MAVQAAAEEAQRRRKMLEAERLGQLEDKARKKQAAQARLEEERRAAVSAKEAHNAAQRVLAKAVQAARWGPPGIAIDNK